MNKSILKKLKQADEEGGFGMFSAAWYDRRCTSWEAWKSFIEHHSGRALALFREQVIAAKFTRAELLYCKENIGEEAWKKLEIEIPEEGFKPYAADSKRVLEEYGFKRYWVRSSHAGYFVEMADGLYSDLTDVVVSMAQCHMNERAAYDAAATWCKENLKEKGK
ncbi:hypothetical protein C4571_02025 [Candidatus Parcubacteria bacterium]|nr:MAG: hypothetical protein C4571_02025 [Candidatus Parcubacteria bacterium]